MGAESESAVFEIEHVDDGPAEPVADFDKATFNVEQQKYGILGLMSLRAAMLPIEKPTETSHLKLLICPGLAGEAAEGDGEADEHREQQRDHRRGGGGREGKGKGKDKGGGRGGRYVQDMGRTEVMAGSQRGQWWRNCGERQLDVIVRRDFELTSPEIWKVPVGHYVQQAGPLEIFVSGQANGLQRMPVLPRGWVTVDASKVGGPKYLEQVQTPRWKVVFQSGSSKGDIVVRAGLSLETEEIAVLLCGATVEQAGPQEVLEDGIVRMPVTFLHNTGGEAADGQRAQGVARTGWVTCDATSQGGPRFFEPCGEESMAWSEREAFRNAMMQPPSGQGSAAAASGNSRPLGEARDGGSWGKNRMWKVVNIGTEVQRSLPVVNRPEPFAPTHGRQPPDDMFVKWLNNGDIVEQVGHSKKMRGYMVMPIRIGPEEEEKDAIGWVTRRLVDKTRDGQEDVWFVELRNGTEAARNDRRRQRRRQDDD